MRTKVFYITAFICMYLFLEICLRLIFSFSTGAEFIHPANVIYKYYPELIPIKQANISNTDSTLDILILSCSVLHKDWADIVTEMNKCIQLPAGYTKVKIYNASGIGHGSRDNLIKYNLLSDKRFDVIIYYDAINDSRLNNCPDDVFKSDYSHYRWYDEINHIINHPEMNFTIIPFFYDWVKIKIKSIFTPGCYIPKHFSFRPQWLAYGNNLKSVKSFETNVSGIFKRAADQHTHVLYLTFAYYLPSNYSLNNFHNKTLDYTFCDHSRETEIWGEPQNVSRFIDTINSSSRNWAGPYKNVKWVDLYSQFPRDGSDFADICHFSPKGIHRFAQIACSELNSMDLNTPF